MSRYFFVLILLVFFAFLALALIYVRTCGPVSSDTSKQLFIINPGESLSTISFRLYTNRLINNRYVFMFLAYQQGLNKKLQAGVFELSPSYTSYDTVRILSLKGQKEYWLKIIEGQRIEEISTKFESSSEGYLFPDSYLIPYGYTQEQIREVISKNFQKKLTQAKQDATNTQMSEAQIITFASLLEREARTLISKQQVAGIILNRLRIGMALQIDATVQYARDSRVRPKKYWLPLSKSDLTISSPFNTYQNPGLPPSPICNPGYDSIYAAYHPVESQYFYYISDHNGQMHYAKSLDEHNQNIARYLK